MTSVPTLRVVSPAEAELLGLRQAALARFDRRYPHPESRRTMRGSLERLARTISKGRYGATGFPWELLCDEDLTAEAWHSVAVSFSRATALKDATALRTVLKCLHQEGLLNYEQYQSAISFNTRSRGQQRSRPGQYVTSQDVSTLAEACLRGDPESVTGIRDAALVLTLASTGARRTEISEALLSNTCLAESRIRLTVTKNGLPRDAWLHQHAVTAIASWQERRGHEGDHLFCPLSRTGRPLTDRRLSPHQIWKIIHRRGTEAGLEGLTPHDLRRYLVSELLPYNDIALVARIVGHRSVDTTARYDRRPDDRCREAVLSLPLRPPPSRLSQPTGLVEAG